MSIIKFKGRPRALEEQLLILKEMHRSGHLIGLVGVAITQEKDKLDSKGQPEVALSVFWADNDNARQDLTYIMATGIDLLKHDFMEDNFRD